MATTHLQKHERLLLRAIANEFPQLKAEIYVKGTGHKRLTIVAPDGRTVTTQVPSSPTNMEHMLKAAMRDVRRWVAS